jgi:hypothetical protein
MPNASGDLFDLMNYDNENYAGEVMGEADGKVPVLMGQIYHSSETGVASLL